MNVHLAECPTNSPAYDLLGRIEPLHGSFLIVVPPSGGVRNKRTRKTLGFQFFSALGKDVGLSGAYTVTTAPFRAQIAHWFAAYEAHTLVVLNADSLREGGVQAIVEYGSTVESIVFVAEPETVDQTRLALTTAGVQPTPMSWDDLLVRLPVIPTPEPLPEPAYTMQHLPLCDFLMFRDLARTLNEPERFKAIDRDYRTAYQAALTVEPANEEVLRTLSTLTLDSTTTAPLLVALRATQAALLTRGWILRVQADKAIGALCSIKPPSPTPQHWRALHGYTRTPQVAGVTLFLLDVPPDDLNTITVGEVEQSLDSGHVRGTPIPDLARPLLRVHLMARHTEDAKPSDPYLNQKGARRHLEDLIDARRHLGIPIDGRQLHAHIPHTHTAPCTGPVSTSRHSHDTHHQAQAHRNTSRDSRCNVAEGSHGQAQDARRRTGPSFRHRARPRRRRL